MVDQARADWPYVTCRRPNQLVCTHHYCQEDDRRILAARLAAVETLHHPSTDHGDGMKPYCVGCWEACGEEGAPLWPCPTIRAVVAADPSEAAT